MLKREPRTETMKKTLEKIIKAMGYMTILLLLACLIFGIFEKKDTASLLAITGAGTGFLYMICGFFCAITNSCTTDPE